MESQTKIIELQKLANNNRKKVSETLQQEIGRYSSVRLTRDKATIQWLLHTEQASQKMGLSDD